MSIDYAPYTFFVRSDGNASILSGSESATVFVPNYSFVALVCNDLVNIGMSQFHLINNDVCI